MAKGLHASPHLLKTCCSNSAFAGAACAHRLPPHDAGDGAVMRPRDRLHTRALRKVPHLAAAAAAVCRRSAQTYAVAAAAACGLAAYLQQASLAGLSCRITRHRCHRPCRQCGAFADMNKHDTQAHMVLLPTPHFKQITRCIIRKQQCS
jgi:hypothetical protein